MAPPARFPIRFTGPNSAMGLLGIDPRRCRVEVDEAQLAVYLGWAFELHAPLADVQRRRSPTTTGCGDGARTAGAAPGW